MLDPGGPIGDYAGETMDTTESPDRLTSRQLAVLLLICAVALALRVYHALAAVVVSPDSALLIEYARQLGDAPLTAVRTNAQHPLYPGLILLLHKPVSLLTGIGPAGWIAAGRIAAIAGSLGAVLAMYWLTARLYSRRFGLIAAALLAVLPDACAVGADVLTDLPHLALYLLGLVALLVGVQTGRWQYFVTAGAAAGLAFLTRPEGASVLVVGLILLALHRQWPLKRRIPLAAGLVGVFLLIAGPYQLATGKLIQKKSLFELLKFGSAAREAAASIEKPASAAVPDHEQWAQQASVAAMPVPLNILRQWLRAGRVVYVVLAILGLAVARPRAPGGRLLAAAVGVHILLLCALQSTHGYLDRRHAMLLATLSLPLAAAGIAWLADRADKRIPGKRDTVVVVLILVCVAATSRWLVRPINAAEEHVVAAGRWLAAHSDPGIPVVGDSRLRRVALYADRPFVEWRWWGGSVKHLATCLTEQQTAYFVVDAWHMTQPERNPDFFDDLADRLGDRLVLEHVAVAPPHARHPTEIRIYFYEER
jgi:4-amino-4-deoxy-L-arabinose transferase-like glycosyltransferase